jgi:CRP-like cAMP-binding protein
MAASLPTQTNHLLAALPSVDAARILALLELVELESARVLYEAGDRIQHVYFPLDCILSLVYVMTDGALAEVSAAGNEGLLDIAAFLGGGVMPTRCIVQSPGYAYRGWAHDIQHEFRSSEAIQSLLLRYTQCRINQIAQTAVCNRHHTVEQQLCRWLLMTLDRLPSNEISITQELIANALGVRREGVNEAAHHLQSLDVTLSSRGHIKVRNRAKLESLCCECYATVKRESDRLMRWPSDSSAICSHDPYANSMF